MKQMPIKEDKIPGYNKKAIRLIVILFICGIIIGLILSNIFLNESNRFIENLEGKGWPKGQVGERDIDLQVLSTADIILLSLGVILACVTTFLLAGLLAIYIKIFFNSNSKYVVGLLFFLSPLLIQSLFFIGMFRTFFTTSRFSIPLNFVRGPNPFGAGFEGLSGVLIILSIFEIVGLSILLYLSSE